MRQLASPLAGARQLILVIAPDWASTTAQLQRYSRRGPASDWHGVGDHIMVCLGKSGMAWGLGLHPPMPGLSKQEGDGRAPAGAFTISALFGYAPQGSPLARSAGLPYLYACADLKAIDDPASAYYNRIVDQSAIEKPDWHSCEEMRRDDQRYEIGAVVDHNFAPAMPGAGSCIFLHVWEKEGTPTAGCTAMSLAAMTEIAGWLDGAASPVLVQLPQIEYERLCADWRLPAFVAHG